jgi:hypothetical protein
MNVWVQWIISSRMMGLIGALDGMIKRVISIHEIPPYSWQIDSKEMYVTASRFILKAVLV